ncbi:MAG: hypothetical protein JKY37_26195 [Nannocystaceae bacterium]|nr:hypothetical protein [Nannocystaceae bacterium]
MIRQPTGLALSADGSVLLVTNGNWDRRAASGTLALVDLVGLRDAITARGGPQSAEACRLNEADGLAVTCGLAPFIDSEQTVVLGDGVGNIAVDRPAGEDGPVRLLVPVRAPASVVWMDLVGGGSGASLACGQDDDGRCDDAHRITRSPLDPDIALPNEPAQVSVGDFAGRFAYVPHLLGGALSLIALDGEAGPELVDVEGDFYREDLFDDDELAGGFAVAQRPCDPLLAPEISRDCTRPVLYSTHRYFPGLRQFSIAPGRDRVLGGPQLVVSSVNAAAVEGRPFMADLAFEDDTGTKLIAVVTTPPALIRVLSTVDDAGALVDELIGSTPLCADPNALAMFRPTGGESLALVACRGAAAVAVVGLSSFRVIRSVAVGEGPSEILVDADRQVAFVSNTEDSTISIVGLDATLPDYLLERARLTSSR